MQRAPLSEQLGFLAATLSGPEHVHATSWAAGGSAWGHVRGQLDLDSCVLVQRQSQEREGTVSFQALNVFVVDRATGHVLLYSFDTVGFPPEPPARGSWWAGDLVLERTTDRGSSRTVYTPTDGGYRWSKAFRSSPDQPWQPIVDGHLSSAPAADSRR